VEGVPAGSEWNGLAQAAATARPCFICYKPTTIVLATINAVDFLYTCPVHLTDPGFATALGESVDGPVGGPRKMGLSPEEIAKVKEEWEERQKKKNGKGEGETEGRRREKGQGQGRETGEGGFEDHGIKDFAVRFFNATRSITPTLHTPPRLLCDASS